MADQSPPSDLYVLVDGVVEVEKINPLVQNLTSGPTDCLSGNSGWQLDSDCYGIIQGTLVTKAGVASSRGQ